MICNLSELCNYAKGKAEVASLDANSYISTENMLPDKAGITIASSLPSVAQTQAFVTGDVLVSNIRPYFKKIWFAEYDGGCSNDVLVFRAKNGTDKRFLYYVLSDDAFFDYSMATSKGTKMPRGDKVAIMNYEVPVFTYETQVKIASVLDGIDQKIKTNNAINQNLSEQIQSIYQNWFGKRVAENDIPEDWHECCLNDVCSLIVKGITPKYDDEAEQRVINQKCIRNHEIDLSLSRKHRPKVINEKWLNYGDLLINSTGEGTLGRAAQVLFEPINLTVDSHITIVRPNSPELIGYIGVWGITHEYDFTMMSTGSTGQTDLPRERLKAMDIIIPSVVELMRFNEVINPMNNIIVQNRQENERLSKLRDLILPRLMSGELDVSDLEL